MFENILISGIAQQNMNYMSLDIINQFTKDRINPFQFRYVRVFVCWLFVGCLLFVVVKRRKK